MSTLRDTAINAGADVLDVAPTSPQPSADAGYLADAFDMLNVRDLDLIDQARSRCQSLTLGVYTDEYAAQVTGRRPIVPLAERVALLSHVRGVDTVVVHQAVPTGSRVFVAAGQVDSGTSDVTILAPRRETCGPLLRDALTNCSEREAVA